MQAFIDQKTKFKTKFKDTFMKFNDKLMQVGGKIIMQNFGVNFKHQAK